MGKFANFTAMQMADYIRSGEIQNDNEWFEIRDWIYDFLKGDPPPEEKKMFVPLGCAEIVGIMCDGLGRRLRAVCFDCKKRTDGKYSDSCQIYSDGIPNEIWAHEDAECPYHEGSRKEERNM